MHELEPRTGVRATHRSIDGQGPRKLGNLAIVMIAAFFLIAPNLVADTLVPPGLIDGATWNPAGSPYVLTGDIQVANLKIEPGVSVLAGGNYEIEVSGLLVACGTDVAPIVFSRPDSVANWKGLFFNFTTLGSQLRYCTIEKSTSRGVRILNSDPIIDHCTFSNNFGGSGGAVNIVNTTLVGSAITFSDCLFQNNTSSGHGGALQVEIVGGILSIVRSTFNNNTANIGNSNGNWVGGALYILEGSANISNSSFFGNRSNARCNFNNFGCSVTARGGAIYIGSNSPIDISGCIFQSNHVNATNPAPCWSGRTTSSYGAGLYVATGMVSVTNSLFANNININTGTGCNRTVRGGGVFVNGGTVNMTNCTVMNNVNATGLYRAGGTLTVANSIVYFNGGGGIQIGGNATVTYSCVQNGHVGTGNIPDNPIVDPEYHLASVSPCKDAGRPSPLDFDTAFPPSQGNARNDMGMFGGPGAFNHLLQSISILDTPGDEGGQLSISWSAFPNDSIGATQPITNYLLQRGPPAWAAPVATWTTLETIPATQLSSYVTTVTTDSTFVAGIDSIYALTNTWPTDIYRVIGETAIPAVSDTSNTNVGMAIDNIAPPQPSVLLAGDSSSRTLLLNLIGAELPADYAETCIYRGKILSLSPFVGAPATLWGESTAPGPPEFIMPGPIDGNGDALDPCSPGTFQIWFEGYRSLFYYVGLAKDVHGNLSIPAVGDTLVPNLPTDVGDTPGVPRMLTMDQNVPNPFNPSTTIKFSVPAETRAALRIYDVTGRIVVTLLDEVVQSGTREIVWRGIDSAGRPVPSGLYFAKLRTQESTRTRRLVLLK